MLSILEKLTHISLTFWGKEHASPIEVSLPCLLKPLDIKQAGAMADCLFCKMISFLFFFSSTLSDKDKWTEWC